MNLYLISQTININYDTYDSAVVAAESEEAARMTHPNEEANWDGKEYKYGTWCNANDVTVKYIGKAAEGISGVICASFNAG